MNIQSWYDAKIKLQARRDCSSGIDDFIRAGKSLLPCPYKFHHIEIKSAFIKNMPRMCGKTTLLVDKARVYGGIIATPLARMAYVVKTVHNIDVIHSAMQLRGTSTADKVLFVDEFWNFDAFKLEAILQNEWKSIIMIGTQ